MTSIARHRGTPSGRRLLVAAVAAAGLVALLPAAASAHPLGNFTINHYAGIRVAPSSVALDVVIDRAEIPTFSERQRIDTDGDGLVSAPELEAERPKQGTTKEESKWQSRGIAVSPCPFGTVLSFVRSAARP